MCPRQASSVYIWYAWSGHCTPWAQNLYGLPPLSIVTGSLWVSLLTMKVILRSLSCHANRHQSPKSVPASLDSLTRLTLPRCSDMSEENVENILLQFLLCPHRFFTESQILILHLQISNRSTQLTPLWYILQKVKRRKTVCFRLSEGNVHYIEHWLRDTQKIHLRRGHSRLYISFTQHYLQRAGAICPLGLFSKDLPWLSSPRYLTPKARAYTQLARAPKYPQSHPPCLQVLCRRLRRDWELRQLQVMLPPFPILRPGAACVPLDPDPPILSSSTNHTAKARRSILGSQNKEWLRGAGLSLEHCL